MKSLVIDLNKKKFFESYESVVHKTPNIICAKNT